MSDAMYYLIIQETGFGLGFVWDLDLSLDLGYISPIFFVCTVPCFWMDDKSWYENFTV